MSEGLNDYGLGFLYKKCTKIRQGTLSRLQYVPEYMEALHTASRSNLTLDDYAVFRIVQMEWEKMSSSGQGYISARRVINQISRDLYGDPHAWEMGVRQKKPEKQVELPGGYEDLSWVLRVLEPTKKSTKTVICKTPEVLDLIRSNGEQTLSGVYTGFCEFFFPLVRSGLKNKNNVIYQRYRRAASDLSDIIYYDKNRWFSDYNSYYNK